MPYVKDNPQWYVIEIVDGFGPHTSSLYAMEEQRKNKIVMLKEEGDSSHVNQGYDKFVSKANKLAKQEDLIFAWLTVQRYRREQ